MELCALWIVYDDSLCYCVAIHMVEHYIECGVTFVFAMAVHCENESASFEFCMQTKSLVNGSQKCKYSCKCQMVFLRWHACT